MSTFTTIVNPTPFGFFDADTAFQTEANGMVTFVKRKLGDDVLSVELTKKQIWACFEEAFLEYGKIVNEYQAKSQLHNFLGAQTGTLSGGENKYPRQTLEFFLRQAEPYAMEASLGGSYSAASGSISLVQRQQDYNLLTDLKDGTGTPLVSSSLNTLGSRMKIMEVFHFSPQAAYRFFDTTSAINYLNNEFAFESFTPETVFYVLPTFEDVLRGGMLKLSNKLRRSNFSYKIVGQNLRIFPMPTRESVQGTPQLWIRVQFSPDPLNPNTGLNDKTINGVSNSSNIPFGNLSYSHVNSIGRQWTRQYCLALSTELLGKIRGKLKTIPIPGGDVSLNGDDLSSQGREDKEKLVTQLREMLDTMTYDKLLEKEVNSSENLTKLLMKIPIPNGGAIRIG
jgi:hypothetical protein